MKLTKKAYAGSAEELGDRQVRVICSTEEVDRAGEVVVQAGVLLDAYRANPVVLWQHDPDQPIARCLSIDLVDGQIEALMQFPPESVSKLADEIYGLIKAGVINTVSIGLDPGETEAMDAGATKGPQRYLTCELWEVSFVSVPANRGATVVQRAHRAHREAPVLVVKSLYDVGRLASLLGELGWIQDSATWEASAEQDASAVPGMLGEAMRQVGDALLAMTKEEVEELLASLETAPIDDADITTTSTAPGVRKFLAAMRGKVAVPPPAVDSSGRRKRAADAKVFALG